MSRNPESEIAALTASAANANTTQLRAVYMREISASGTPEAAMARMRRFSSGDPDPRDRDLVSGG